MTIRFVRSAEAELYEIRDWYEGRETGLGQRFLTEVSQRLQSVDEDPDRFPQEETNPSSRDVRRCLLHRFPHRIIYELISDEIRVLAIAHGSREPGYWSGRMDEE